MEVIEHGKTFKTIKCNICRAEIGYTACDIEHTSVNDVYDKRVHTTKSDYIFCPECGCRLILSLTIDGVDREICRD